MGDSPFTNGTCKIAYDYDSRMVLQFCQPSGQILCWKKSARSPDVRAGNSCNQLLICLNLCTYGWGIGGGIFRLPQYAGLEDHRGCASDFSI